MEHLIVFFRDKPLAKVLDVGTGTGNLIPVLKMTFPNAKIVGVDPDPDSLAKAAERFPDNEFLKMTGEQLDFGDNTFDVASISMALHHLTDVQQTLGEMKRVVKPGGWLLVIELFSDDQNQAQEVHKQMHHFRSRIDRMKGVVHNESFTRKEIVEHIEKAGLSIEFKFEFRNPSQPPTAAEIEERKGKLWEAVESIKNSSDYEKMRGEIPAIEKALEKHGFEMATRLVCVARVTG